MSRDDDSESEKYYRRKNANRRKRKVGRAVATTGCCGFPCLITLALFVSILGLVIVGLRF